MGKDYNFEDVHNELEEEYNKIMGDENHRDRLKGVDLEYYDWKPAQIKHSEWDKLFVIREEDECFEDEGSFRCVNFSRKGCGWTFGIEKSDDCDGKRSEGWAGVCRFHLGRMLYHDGNVEDLLKKYGDIVGKKELLSFVDICHRRGISEQQIAKSAGTVFYG